MAELIIPHSLEIMAAVIFAIAVLHTFSTAYFEHLARRHPAHAGLWHLLGEVEAVFGFWAMVLLVFLVFHSGSAEAIGYLESRSFTEPAFVFVIMVIAASRPIIDFAGAVLQWISRLLPVERPVAYYFTVLSVGQLKILQEIITLSVFVPFALFYLREPLKLDYLWAALCILGAAFFIFRGKFAG